MQRKINKYYKNCEYWKCPTCEKWLPRDNYYADKRAWNGIKSQCKKCHTAGSLKTRSKENANRLNREYAIRARKKNPEKFRKRERLYSKSRPKDIKYYARICLNNAVKGGIIKKPNVCEKCWKVKKLSAHHTDYNKPLEVEWLCYLCHGNK